MARLVYGLLFLPSQPMTGPGREIPPAAGAALNGAAPAWLKAVKTDTRYTSGLLGPMPVSGVGTGMMFTPLTMLGVFGTDPAERGAASGLLDAMRQAGGSLGR